MAIIKSGVDATLLTVVPKSKSLNGTLYDSSGNEITSVNKLDIQTSKYFLLKGSVGAYSTASFYITGVAVTTQVLGAIWNNGGPLNIAIRRLGIGFSRSAAAVDLVNAYVRLWVGEWATPTGGAIAAKNKLDSAYPASQPATNIIFAAPADGVADTIYVGVPGMTPHLSASKPNQFTNIYAARNVRDMLLVKKAPVIIQPGETGVIILSGSAADLVTNHYTINVTWEEF